MELMEDVVSQLAKDTTLLCFMFLLFLKHFSSAFTPEDGFFIDCGSNQTNSIDSRIFVGDAQTNSNSFQLVKSSSAIALEDPSPSTDSSLLYRTARIFITPSSYEFKLKSNGVHVVRFHFFPFSSQYYNLSSAVFDVSVSGRLLLEDFSFQNEKSAPVIKEYFLRLNSEELVISFSPSTKSSSYAFVNAIEVFSAPQEYFNMGVSDYSVEALEIVHRINVGGPEITSSGDPLWRTWIPDEGFLKLRSVAKQAVYYGAVNYRAGMSNPEIAPEGVYNTTRELNRSSEFFPYINMTWIFPLNSRHKSGYKYLVRLHFCDIVSVALYELYFNVYINGNLACEDLDLSSLTNKVLAVPYYADFKADSDNSGVIRVSVGPSDIPYTMDPGNHIPFKMFPSKRNAILNGVEIMKMVRSFPSPSIRKLKQHTHHTHLLVALALGGFCFLSVLILAFLLIFKLKKKSKSKHKFSSKLSAGRKIPLVDIQLATNNFDKDLLIGHGGFGNVYKGVLKNGEKVAVKRRTPGSRQGLSEFQTEIKIFSRIRHRHLVSLIGYCEEESEMILIYEFMENGTLNNHLYGSSGLPCLSWRQRLQICIGAARGLHYLHSGPAEGIIHRDVKSANILLDQNYLAKVADFGISRLVSCPDQSHVTTNIKGSFGYFDPEYFRWHHLTKKSDVYSFGVVLLEALCARPAIDHSLPYEEVNLANWAMQWQKRGLLEQIIDPHIAEEINADSLQKFGEITEKCLAECGAERPTICDVLWNLEFAMRLQDTATHRKPPEDSTQSASAYVSSSPTTRKMQIEPTNKSSHSAPVSVEAHKDHTPFASTRHYQT